MKTPDGYVQMTEASMKQLRIGDIVRHWVDHKPLVVTGVYGSRVTATRTADITNPSEWLIYEHDLPPTAPEPEVWPPVKSVWRHRDALDRRTFQVTSVDGDDVRFNLLVDGQFAGTGLATKEEFSTCMQVPGETQIDQLL